jgi:alpha-1,6-mannosyltransferase
MTAKMIPIPGLRNAHLVDMTMFYAADGGGVRTYLDAKARWIGAQPGLRHSVVGPAMRTVAGGPDFDEHEDRQHGTGHGSARSAADQPGGGSITVPSVPIPVAGRYRVLLSVGAAARRARALQPSLIEVGDPFQFAWAAMRIKRSHGIPIVAYHHSDLSTILHRRFGPLAGQAATRYLKSVYQAFDLVLAPSRRTAQFLRDKGIDSVLHQPLGVDTTVFHPRFRQAELRQRLGLAPDTRLLVYAGRFTTEKKLALLIDAVHALGAPYHLLMIGNGDTPPASPQISHLPFQRCSRTLSGLIAGCDLLVHPGDQETFGLVVLEAMASGVPVLGVAAGGVAELVNARNGMLVAPGSSAALREGITTLFRQDLPRLGLQARESVVGRYDWSVIFPQLLRQYGYLLTSQRNRHPGARLAYDNEH